jgi:hypothetical protein
MTSLGMSLVVSHADYVLMLLLLLCNVMLSHLGGGGYKMLGLAPSTKAKSQSMPLHRRTGSEGWASES